MGIFRLQDNMDVKELPEKAFGNAAFKVILVRNTSVKIVYPSALLSSKYLLSRLAVENSRLNGFPFYLLPELQRLEVLSLEGNYFVSVPLLQSPSLKLLSLARNEILRLDEEGWTTPILRSLNISYNPQLNFRTTITKNLGRLETFDGSGLNLGPILSGGTLEFRSRTLREIWLDFNNISSLEPNAIRGNPIQCDCGLDWFAFVKGLMANVRNGKCENGTEFKNLHLDSLRNCRLCPYKCIKAEEFHLCAPGTLIQLKEGDCRPGEFCCEPRSTLVTAVTEASMVTPRPLCPLANGSLCIDVAYAALCDTRTSLFHACPLETQICCQIHGSDGQVAMQSLVGMQSCPSTHTCIPTDSAQHQCKPGTQIRNSCNENRVCCVTSTTSNVPYKVPTKGSSKAPSLSHCEYKCISQTSSRSCVPGTTNKMRVECKTGDIYCCQVNCDPSFGRCMAAYLSEACRAHGDRDFTDLFRCSGKHRCCALKTAIEKRELEVVSNRVLPTSSLTNETCWIEGSSTISNSSLRQHCWNAVLVDPSGKMLCGGALIERQFVVTTASCFFFHRQYKIGQLAIRVSGSPVRHRIATDFSHRKFREETFENDLGMIILEKSVKAEEEACLLCTQDAYSVQEFSECRLISHFEGRVVMEPVEYAASIVDSSVCQEKILEGSGLPSNSMCVAFSSAWCGESGAPLICKDASSGFYRVSASKILSGSSVPVINRNVGIFQLAGLLSLPIQQCQPADVPGVFANATSSLSTSFYETTFTASVFLSKSPTDRKEIPETSEDEIGIGTGSGLEEIEGSKESDCIRDGKYVLGSTVTYKCDQFYILRGSGFRTCRKIEQWTGHIPFCEAECGRKLQHVELSAGGKPAPKGEWPWQVAIYDGEKRDLICGGALIAERWVLTAAHCITVDGTTRARDARNFVVYLGKYYRNDSLDNEYVQRRVALLPP
ncbi:unnamed protein product [Darwinula stevensoni]|uniref:Limulus clotting factor C n=1 Tax=Darwinula stevensoni TaxID=69355 RepID=A0A7R9A5A4_9CRUS|nr:unnamed protein product [Darwinula stevensoni]CAG0884969.1 unnamed protein product [Darwinula stevensoni]